MAFFADYLWWRDNQAAMNNVRSYSRRRYQRDTTSYLDRMSNTDFVELYRLDKYGLAYFADRISDHAAVNRSTQGGLSAVTQLLVALRYYATGNSIISLKNTAGFELSHGSVYNAIKNVSTALGSLVNEDVSYPFDLVSMAEIKSGFAHYGGFPACIGAIDGSQIKIKAPPQNENIYVGRKTDGHYLNVQFVCDSKLKFLDTVIKWPGSVNDSTIWDMCGLKESLQEFLEAHPRSYKGWLIGDSGYDQRRNLMTPFEEPQNKPEEAYNIAHKKCRCSIERAIGVLKSRFRCLCKQTGGCIQFDIDVICQIIASCVVLHNYCRDRNIEYPIDENIQRDLQDERDSQVRRDTNNTENKVILGYRARQSVVAEYFNVQ